MCVFFLLFSLSDNKYTLCLAFVLLRVCLRTTRELSVTECICRYYKKSKERE